MLLLIKAQIIPVGKKVVVEERNNEDIQYIQVQKDSSGGIKKTEI